MKRYSGINFERYEDCFAKTKDVPTEFLYGKPDNIPTPLFTIVIPTYKRVELLKEALESAIHQWHVSFSWDILVIDNEPYDGKPNATEKLIRKLDHPRILYYRNHENLRPGDNFNRGIFLARGKWVMMLHDDDLLFSNSLQNMGRVVRFLEKNTTKPLGAVNTMYYQFTYDQNAPQKCKAELQNMHNYFISLPTNFWLYKLTHRNILFTGHIGGDVPSNGATFNRSAVLDMGGFNDDFGISADLILNYCMENKYAVYSTTVPYGFYRWGANTMSQSDSVYRTVKAGFDFREYVFSKNFFTWLWGKLFRASLYRRFTGCVILQRKQSVKDNVTLSDFNYIYSKRPNMHWYAFYTIFIERAYMMFKTRQMKKLYKKSLKDEEIWQ